MSTPKSCSIRLKGLPIGASISSPFRVRTEEGAVELVVAAGDIWRGRRLLVWIRLTWLVRLIWLFFAFFLRRINHLIGSLVAHRRCRPVRRHEPTERGAVVPSAEVIEAGFGVAFFAGELGTHRVKLTAFVGADCHLRGTGFAHTSETWRSTIRASYSCFFP